MQELSPEMVNRLKKKIHIYMYVVCVTRKILRICEQVADKCVKFCDYSSHETEL